MKHAPLLALALAPLACAGAEPAPVTPAEPPSGVAVVDLGAKPAPATPQPAATGKPADAPAAPKEGDGQQFGMIGLLNSGGSGDPNAPTTPWGADGDPAPGSAFGAGGLGLSGVGAGGGGQGATIGLGGIGTLGHGAGTGTGYGSGVGGLGLAKPKSMVRLSDGRTVSGRLPPEVIQRIVRASFGRFRACYENGLKKNPQLQGRVVVKFVIGTDGKVTSVSSDGSTMPDAGVVACVRQGVGGLAFPKPEGGIVTVTYPIQFTPADEAPAKQEARSVDPRRAVPTEAGPRR